MNNWKGKLQELCQSRGIPLPFYDSFQNDDKLWVSTVVVESASATSPLCRTKKEAEQKVAKQAYDKLRTPSNPTTSNPTETKDTTPLEPFMSLLSNVLGNSRGMNQGNNPLSSLFSALGNSMGHNPPANRNASPANIALDMLSSIASSLNSERSFPVNLFDLEFVKFLETVVRNKPVHISISDQEYPEALILIRVVPMSENLIKAKLHGGRVTVSVPKVNSRVNYQAMMMLHMSMELGAQTCTVLDV